MRSARSGCCPHLAGMAGERCAGRPRLRRERRVPAVQRVLAAGTYRPRAPTRRYRDRRATASDPADGAAVLLRQPRLPGKTSAEQIQYSGKLQAVTGAPQLRTPIDAESERLWLRRAALVAACRSRGSEREYAGGRHGISASRGAGSGQASGRWPGRGAGDLRAAPQAAGHAGWCWAASFYASVDGGRWRVTGSPRRRWPWPASRSPHLRGAGGSPGAVLPAPAGPRGSAGRHRGTRRRVRPGWPAPRPASHPGQHRWLPE